MSPFALTLLLLLPLLHGPAFDAHGSSRRHAIARNNGSCVDPDGRPCGGTPLTEIDKGLGVDPNG